MTDQSFPFNPPTELVRQWIRECDTPKKPSWQEYEQDIPTPAPNFRALCKELLGAVDTLYKQSVTTPYSQTIELDGVLHPIPIGKDILAQDAIYAHLMDNARAALATPLGRPKNCWLDDEPYLCPSPCVFDDPSEVISDCTYAQTVKCKTDCMHYRVATPPPEAPTELPSLLTAALKLREENDLSRLFMPKLSPPPEPPTDEELDELFIEIDQSGETQTWRSFARAALERWGQ